MISIRPVCVCAVAALGVVACSEDRGRGGGDPDVGSVDAGAEVSVDADGDAAEGDAGGDAAIPGAKVTYTEEREPCENRSPTRNVYWGDLHVHTSYSFDAYAWNVRSTPSDAYEFARGEALEIPAPNEPGASRRSAQLDRPLDFAAVTDHAEYFGEVRACADPDAPVYDTETCEALRTPGDPQYVRFSNQLFDDAPDRIPEICGDGAADCTERARKTWRRVQNAAEQAYDRSKRCEFTSLVGYEYTNMRDANNLHRNVIFRNAEVPGETVSAFDRPSPVGLWRELESSCLESEGECDVLTIPHNSNLSSGAMFGDPYRDADSTQQKREVARLRGELERLMEVFQHKGSMECRTGFRNPLGAPDEYCGFEKMYDSATSECGGRPGSHGMMGLGCVDQSNYLRGALVDGMEFGERLGVNPYRLGVVASTDTHNATAGSVDEEEWKGHFGIADASADARLDTFQGLTFITVGAAKSSGGLAGVWAVENSRDAIFEALERRETFGTSGPRITVRLFGGWGFEEGMCASAEMLERGYRRGVPMGGVLPASASTASDSAPRFVVQAAEDPGTAEEPGVPLQHVQIIKGTYGPGGEREVEVFDVAGDPDNGAGVDTSRCAPTGDGFETLCTTWRDPSFDPEERAFY